MNDFSPKFRLGAIDDTTLLVPVLKRALEHRDGVQHDDVVLFDHLSERMNRIDAITDIAMINNSAVGFAVSHPLVDDRHHTDSTDTHHLSLLMVDPDHWSKQIASRLICLVKERSYRAHKRRVTLYTLKYNNDRAQNLYTRHGFTLTGTEKMSDNGILVQYEYLI